MPIGTSTKPVFRSLPVRANTLVPLLFSVPIAANCAAPCRSMCGRLASVSTLLMTVGLPNNPLVDGKGGRIRGKPRYFLIEAISAVSSPQTNAPVPRKISRFMVKSGGNHRTIHPVIQNMGYSGSCNAIYQYILKLRKEHPEQFQYNQEESPPELTIESYPRDKVYSGILNEAAKSRPKNEAAKKDTQIATKKASSKRSHSPFNKKVTDLILGPAKEDDEEKKEKREARKKRPRTLHQSHRDVPDNTDTY